MNISENNPHLTNFLNSYMEFCEIYDTVLHLVYRFVFCINNVINENPYVCHLQGAQNFIDLCSVRVNLREKPSIHHVKI